MTPTLLALSIAVTTAFAQDDTDTAPEPAPAVEDTEPSILAGPYAKKPYAKPVVGAVVFDNAAALSVGVDAGLKYQQESSDGLTFFGKTRALPAYVFGTGVTGYDVRVGSFFGPFYKVVGLQAGSNIEWPATAGMDLPITALFDVKVFNAYAGVSPGWYFGGERENVNNALGQYSVYAGAGLNLSKLRIALGWSRLTTAYGENQGISIGFGL